jgi:hypothetical protein
MMQARAMGERKISSGGALAPHGRRVDAGVASLRAVRLCEPYGQDFGPVLDVVPSTDFVNEYHSARTGLKTCAYSAGSATPQ